jgi:hypothetical protein
MISFFWCDNGDSWSLIRSFKQMFYFQNFMFRSDNKIAKWYLIKFKLSIHKILFVSKRIFNLNKRKNDEIDLKYLKRKIIICLSPRINLTSMMFKWVIRTWKIYIIWTLKKNGFWSFSLILIIEHSSIHFNKMKLNFIKCIFLFILNFKKNWLKITYEIYFMIW